MTLTDVLEPSSPPKYWLSARAARGILRRAQKRGRTIHPTLLRALSAVAGDSPGTTSTGGLGSLSGMGNGGPDDNDAQANRIVAVPLTSGGHPNSNAPDRRKEDDHNIVAFHPTGGGAKGLSENEHVAPGVGTGAGGTVSITGTVRSHVRPGSNASNEVVDGETVRRLMPVECERLQGFPDGWTDLGGTPDSPRYSAMGDAVTVNVAEWIGGRLVGLLG
ncbi:MAG TPA: DNA cytosine methyltransferase [Gaiellaceae bacterium]|nr:DNA cytosine methyltransferase [Gaiellaceae bacterium]